jgi:hypothetical protein
VYSLERLSHCSDLTLFTGVREDHNDKSLLGIYSHTKVESKYNLLHWVVGKEGDNAHIFSGNINWSDSHIVKAFALKPQYSYYFISKFFEDIFVDVLKELNAKFINNIELKYNGKKETSIEIDSIIKKNNGSLIVVENKTNLSKENIESTLRKFEKFHSEIIREFPNVDIEYLLIAPYSNDSVEEGFYYFIKSTEKMEEKQRTVNRNIYDFSIPFARFENLKLRCIIEPEYSQLKSKIKSLL